MDIDQNEKTFLKIARWVWRNTLASGVVLVCFGYLYNKLDNIESDLKEVQIRHQESDKIIKLFMMRDRGDFGFAAYAVNEPQFTSDAEAEEYYDGLQKKYKAATKQINQFIEKDE